MPFWEKFKKTRCSVYLASEIFRSHMSGNLSFFLLSGIKDQNNNCIGFIGATINWDSFFDNFIRPIKVGHTGYLAVTDAHGRNIGHQKNSLNLKSLVQYDWMRQLLVEKGGSQFYVFQGIPKLMAFRKSDESGWLITTSVNEKELIEGAIYSRKKTLYVGIVFLLIVLVSVGYVSVFKLNIAQKNLIKNEYKFKMLFDHGQEGVFVHSVNSKGETGVLKEFNDAFCNILRMSRESLEKMHPEDVFLITDEIDYAAMLNKILIDDYYHIDAQMKFDSRILYVEVRFFSLNLDSGMFIMGFMRDITHRMDDQNRLNLMVKKRTCEIKKINSALCIQIEEKEKFEKSLRKSEKQYKNIILRANEGILIVQNDIILLANNKLLEILHYKSMEVFLEIPFIALLVPNSVKTFQNYCHLAFANQTIDPLGNVQFLTKEGTKVDVELTVGVAKTIHGVTELYIFVRDITEKKRLKREEKRRQENIIQTDKLVALGTLVSGVAHEINNPNNAIMINAPILADAWLSIEPIMKSFKEETGDFMIAGMPYSVFRTYALDMLLDIQKNSQRINNIVLSLKTFYQPIDKNLKENVDINFVVKSSITLMSNLIFKSTQNFKVEYEDDLPAVYGSFQQLEQVVVNLLQNACHALENMSQAVFISTHFVKHSNCVEFIIKDEGRGIAKEDLAHVTDLFFTTKRDSGGTGLGLAVSFGIIKKHKGALYIDSQLGQGATITVSIPITGMAGA